LIDEIGKPKLTPQHFTPEGLTSVQPF